jgi:hypothetical protein
MRLLTEAVRLESSAGGAELLQPAKPKINAIAATGRIRHEEKPLLWECMVPVFLSRRYYSQPL